jgi:hypothetical protein
MSDSKNTVQSPEDQLAAMQAEFDALQAENTALKAKRSGGGGTVTIKSACMTNQKDAKGEQGKGTVGVYGTARYPLTAYPNQWVKVFKKGAEMAQYILTNADNLGFKDGHKEPTLAFLEEALPGLLTIANIGSDAE